ncbi:hypothetical protein ACFSQ7_11345 [Paenibacillus rhizoplanae]
MNAGYQAAVGGTAHDLLGQFKVNKAFISAGGISLSEGITDYHLEEALISRKMMERAEESILVADHSKFGITTFCPDCSAGAYLHGADGQRLLCGMEGYFLPGWI